MSYVHYDPSGWRIFLNHEEREGLAGEIAKGIAATSAAMIAMGIPALAAGIIAGALVAHSGWELAWMAERDQGNGVVLEAPVPLWIGMIVIVKTREPDDRGAWATDTESEITTWDRDIIKTHLDHGALATDEVEFVLRNHSASGWAKGYILRDGEGSEWTEIAHGGQEVRNGLWYHQTKNGQNLTLIKAKIWGTLTPIIHLDELDRLQRGDRVTFTWLRDS